MKHSCTVDGNYKYIENSPVTSVFRVFIRGIIILIFPPFFKLIYGYRVYGKENLPKRGTGFVVVSTHVHYLDCIMIGCLLKLRPTYYISQKSNLKIPVAGRLIKKLRALPLPDTTNGYRKLINSTSQIIEDNGVIVIYPEGSIEHHCDKIREFKRGAFHCAVKSSAHVIPIVIVCQKRNHLPDRITLHILPQLSPNGSGKFAEIELKENTYNKMNVYLKNFQATK